MVRLLDRPYMKTRKNNGVLWEPTGSHWEDTGINTDEEAASGEVEIDVDADASSAIPAGSIIMIGSEPMSVTATGTTLTVVRTQAVVHANGTDIYKKVRDCVLWLPGQDDAQSSTIRDRSGNGNDGTITNATWAQTGQGLVYIHYDGDTDYTRVADSSSLDITDKITILIWARTTAWNWPGHTGTDGWVIEKGAANDSVGYGIRGHDTLQKFFYHIRDGGVDKAITGGVQAAGTWFLVSMTYDGTTLTGYINGVADGTPLTYSGDIDSSNGFPLVIGSNDALTREYYGDLALCRVLGGVALSAAQIFSIYNQERHLFGV